MQYIALKFIRIQKILWNSIKASDFQTTARNEFNEIKCILTAICASLN